MRYRLRTLLIALALVPPLIAWLSIPYLRGRYSRQSRAKTQLNLFADAIKIYCLDTGELPSGLNDLVIYPAQLTKPASWQGPYLEQRSPPLDPWGQPFEYKVVDHATASFEICSNGRDKKSGTSDDVRLNTRP